MNNSDELYRRTQFGSTFVMIMLGVLIFINIMAWITNEPPWMLRAIEIALVCVTIPGLTLTVRVSRTAVEWWFPFGLLRQRVPLSQIEYARTTKTGFASGFGVRWSGDYTRWSVSGFEATTLDLADGRHVSIGSPEAKRLANVINDARQVLGGEFS
jgi:hypothetical protein